MAELTETFKRLENDPQGGSHSLLSLLETFVAPLLSTLDRTLDKRVVRMFVQYIVAIIRQRTQPQGLGLSKLGSCLEGYGQRMSAAAGTKRVGNLLRSLKWSGKEIDGFLLREADEAVQELHAQRVGWQCAGKSRT